MRMLDVLLANNDYIREADEWAADFVENIQIQKDAAPGKPLTRNQFKKLYEIYDRFKRG